MPSDPRRAAVVCLAVFASGLAALAAVSLLDRREQAFTLGVTPSRDVVRLAGGDTVCQGPIDAAVGFDAVALTLAAPRPPAPPVTVRVLAGRRELAVGSAGGYGPGRTAVVVKLDHVEGGRRIAVCLTAGGREGRAAVYGNSGLAVRGGRAVLNGRRRPADLQIAFLREEAVSLLSLVPEMVRRASLFHGAAVGVGLVWVVLALVLTALPALLALALIRTGGPEEEPDEDRPSALQPIASARE